MKARDIFSLTARCVLGLAIIFTVGVHLYIMQPGIEIAGTWIMFFLSLAWGLLPYGILLDHVSRLGKRDAAPGSVLVLLVAAVILTSVAVWIYLQALSADSGGTYGGDFSADLLYSIPMAENMAALIAVALASGVNAISNRNRKSQGRRQPPSDAPADTHGEHDPAATHGNTDP